MQVLERCLHALQLNDQGIINSDPRFIAVPDQLINIIPTGEAGPEPLVQGLVHGLTAPATTCADWHGLTFSRTPQQIIRILTMASPDSKGVRFWSVLWKIDVGASHSPALQAFFPEGLLGEITSWQGYDAAATGVEAWPTRPGWPPR